MKFISHRGNLDGKKKDCENKPHTILNCISLGFDVEVDIWVVNKKIYLGHDKAEYEINIDFLESNRQNLWIHAKNSSALELLNKTSLNYFWHQEDSYTLTSHHFIWVYPDKKLINNSIAVMPEIANYDLQELQICYGICSDNILSYYNSIKIKNTI